MSDEPLELPPVLADRYRATRELGRGAFGRVLHAIRLDDDLPVAIKLLMGEAVQAGVLRERFLREGRAGQSLDHPNIVRVYEVGEAEEPYLVQELVTGGTVEDLIARNPRGLDPVMAAGLVDGVLAGLQTAHAQGVTHRDLKPANILLDTSGRPKLADFGLAHAANEAALTATGAILGTPLYMAPGQVLGETPGPAWDVYAVAAIYYELLVGLPAFRQKGISEVLMAKQNGVAAGPLAEGAQISPGLDKLIRTALGPDHGVHFPEVASFREALEGLRKLEELGLDTPTSKARESGSMRTSVLDASPGDSTAPPPRPAEEPAPPPAPPPAPRPGWVAPALLMALGIGWGWGLRAGAPEEPAPSPSASAEPRPARWDGVMRRIHLRLKGEEQVKQVLALEGNEQFDRHYADQREAAGVVEQALGAEDFVDLAARVHRGEFSRDARRRFLEVIALQELLGRASRRGQVEDLRGPRQRSLDDAYRKMVRLRRLPVAGLPTTTLSGPVVPERVEAFEATWARIRGYRTVRRDLDDKGRRYANVRVRRASPRGIPFEDPVGEQAAAFLASQIDIHRDSKLIAAAPYEALEKLAEVPDGDLELIVRAQAWDTTVQLRLELHGAEERVTIPVMFTLGEPEPELTKGHCFHRIRIDRVLVPAGAHQIGMRFVGIQPLTDGECVVYMTEVWQRVAGDT